ncbi:unnamed protein product [Diatraea saccharalis]|uniref:Meckelin n=1 Tax=Diatraea saccharalis TaxID=40085 RepID=A0A9N9RF51_9NEOP|nr:unnamed protein product [Diatraea saccharalis]
MVASVDGFSCSCEENSIPVGIARCKQCNTTEVVSADGSSCVPRKCQIANNRFICRKCPSDYISVTQNVDGSPSKEVVCVKCARGYKAQNNVCVRCASCICPKTDIAVKNVCVPKRFLSERPKYDGNMPGYLLMDVLKNEYLCINGDLLACRTLAAGCVHSMYSADLAGPCQMWLQPKIAPPKGLPDLVITPSVNELKPGEFVLAYGTNTLTFVLAIYTFEGGFEILQSTKEKKYQCILPIEINMGTDISVERDNHKVGSLRVHINIEAHYKGKTSISPSITTSLRVEHEMPSAGIRRGMERKRIASFMSRVDMSDNGVVKGLAERLVQTPLPGPAASVYAAIRSRPTNESHSSMEWKADNLYMGWYSRNSPFSVCDSAMERCDASRWITFLIDTTPEWVLVRRFSIWFTTLHALAVEAGFLGLALPLSETEEYFIKAFVYSSFALKSINIVWLNWKQCCYDIFFLDWNEYNSTFEDEKFSNNFNWRASTLAREWNRVQAVRRAPPSYTVVLALIILNVKRSWLVSHKSIGYRWAAASIAWWLSYSTVLVTRWALERLTGAPPSVIPGVCRGVGISLLVFQEERYAHYVNGRSDEDKDMRMTPRPLSMCRIVMSLQLRIVYNQLSSSTQDDSDAMTKQATLSRLLAAFFERALDGLNWVASERTVMERLLDVELSERESGTTSVLLYDSADNTPSCVAVTWWGEEWSLGTFDAMLFGLIMLTTDEPLLAAVITLGLWQVMQYVRHSFGQRNQMKKMITSLYRGVSTDVESSENRETLKQKRCNTNSEVFIDENSPSCASESEETTIKTRFTSTTTKMRTTKTNTKVIPRGPFYDFLMHICDALLNNFKVNRVHKYFKILGKCLDGLGSGFFMRMEIDRFVRFVKKKSVYSGKKLRQYVMNFINIISSGKPMMNQFFHAMNSIFSIYDKIKMDDYIYLLKKYGRKEINVIGDRTRWIFKEFIFGKFYRQKDEVISDIKHKLILADIEYEKSRKNYRQRK